MLKAALVDVGRRKANYSFDVPASGPIRAILREVSKHLMSGDIDLIANEDETEFEVVVGGFRPVGKVLLEKRP